MDDFFEMQSFCMSTVIAQKVYGKNAEEAAKNKDSIDADALSTAIFIQGLKEDSR